MTTHDILSQADPVAGLRVALREEVARQVPGDGVLETAVPGLWLGRLSSPQPPVHSLFQPALCLILQGRKRVLLGGEVYDYDDSRYLLFAQNLPVSGHVTEASALAPYLGLRLDLDVAAIASLAMDLQLAAPPAAGRGHRAIFTGALSPDLLAPLLRLVRLATQPEDVPTLAPLILRELNYRLLKSAEGGGLLQLALADSHSQRIARVIDTLRRRFQEPLRVEALASEVHMSASALHHQFKAVTAMSPLQYQKQLRLQEARRLLLSERLDAATAGHRVGYDSQSQFSREYSRLFGAPPARDIKRLREAGGALVAG